MHKIVPCLWFDGVAEEAARHDTSIFTDSRIDRVSDSAADNPSTRKGEVLEVEFTLNGQPFIGLNGGPDYTFNEAKAMLDMVKIDVEQVRDAYESVPVGPR
jgi:predicted 3-demethylubiquinone-9 3-methyltransferase (glyoxalase superfamily)